MSGKARIHSPVRNPPTTSASTASRMLSAPSASKAKPTRKLHTLRRVPSGPATSIRTPASASHLPIVSGVIADQSPVSGLQSSVLPSHPQEQEPNDQTRDTHKSTHRQMRGPELKPDGVRSGWHHGSQKIAVNTLDFDWRSVDRCAPSVVKRLGH